MPTTPSTETTTLRDENCANYSPPPVFCFSAATISFGATHVSPPFKRSPEPKRAHRHRLRTPLHWNDKRKSSLRATASTMDGRHRANNRSWRKRRQSMPLHHLKRPAKSVVGRVRVVPRCVARGR